jgi:hypothetical protein
MVRLVFPARPRTRPWNEMSAKQIDVTCPCCSTRLTVDVLTGQVLRRSQPAGAAEGPAGKDQWTSAQERVRERTNSGEDKLRSALDHERGKAARFDEIFQKAREKHSPKKDEDLEG